jgi:hypothetical protein
MSPLAQVTDVDQDGGSGEDDTLDQCGVPERESDVTVQPRPTAARQMRDPWACKLRRAIPGGALRELRCVSTYRESQSRRRRQASSSLLRPLACVGEQLRWWRANRRGGGETGWKFVQALPFRASVDVTPDDRTASAARSARSSHALVGLTGGAVGLGPLDTALTPAPGNIRAASQ